MRARRAIQRCRRCRGEVPLEDTVWIDGSGAFCEEDGEGKPYCYSCVPQVEAELIRAADRELRRVEEYAVQFHREHRAVLEEWRLGPPLTQSAGLWDSEDEDGGSSAQPSSAEPRETPESSVTAPSASTTESASPATGGPPIERIPDAEVHCGVDLRGLNGRVDSEGDVHILGEIAARSGTTISHDLEITIIGYDAQERVLAVRNVPVSAETFFALEPISVWLFTNAVPERVRIFPRRV